MRPIAFARAAHALPTHTSCILFVTRWCGSGAQPCSSVLVSEPMVSHSADSGVRVSEADEKPGVVLLLARSLALESIALVVQRPQTYKAPSRGEDVSDERS